MATLDQLLSIRGTLEGSESEWKRIADDYVDKFEVHYPCTINGVYYAHMKRNMDRATAFEILRGIVRDTDYTVVQTRNVFPEVDHEVTTLKQVFMTTLYDGLEDTTQIADMTYIKSRAKIFRQRMGLTTPQLVKILRDVLPFIDSTNSKGIHNRLKNILQLDKFACPRCLYLARNNQVQRVNILHVSDDKCPVCGYKNKKAVHHVNREMFGDWKASDSIDWHAVDNRLSKEMTPKVIRERQIAIYGKRHAHLQASKVALPADAGYGIPEPTAKGESFYELTHFTREEN